MTLGSVHVEIQQISMVQLENGDRLRVLFAWEPGMVHDKAEDVGFSQGQTEQLLLVSSIGLAQIIITSGSFRKCFFIVFAGKHSGQQNDLHRQEWHDV